MLGRALVALALPLFLACASPKATPSPPPAAAVVLPIAVLSGRPQPAAARTAVAVGSPIVLQLEGLGPPKGVVIAPDGSRVPATEAPLVRNGREVGTQLELALHASGTYRVELVDVPGEALALLEAR